MSDLTQQRGNAVMAASASAQRRYVSHLPLASKWVVGSCWRPSALFWDGGSEAFLKSLKACQARKPAAWCPFFARVLTLLSGVS